MSLDRIVFEESDYKYPRLEPLAEEIADFLIKFRSKFKDFCEFMRISSTWTLTNYNPRLERWASTYVGPKKRAAADSIKLAELTSNIFDVCKTQDDINKIRGLIPEKIFERVFDDRHSNKECNIDYGVKVKVDGELVIYSTSEIYETPEDSNKTRVTVDAGFWDGEEGEFIEIKFNPEAFHTKDINYLRELSKKLTSKNLEYCIYLVSFGDKSLTKYKLESLGLWELDNEFVLLGRDEIFSF